MNSTPSPHLPPRRTRIIATLGPATESEEALLALMKAGANIFRLNMSHGSHDWVRKVVERIRRISAETNIPVSMLMDTQGPAIRTGDLQQALDLKPGDRFTFTVRGALDPEHHSVDVNYDDLVSDINVGDTVLVDNGVIHMRVLDKDERQIHCEVLTPGTLGSRRHINLPGVRVNLPALTEKDIADVRLAIELKLPFIAMSFVRDADDVRQLRQMLEKEAPGQIIRIIAKIEDQCAIRNRDTILAEADAIMVARGDLGVECPFEDLPIIQRSLVKSAILAKRPVIVATHMLESMISNPLPTRAEVTDVANAVYEQADAVMLSGETSVGRYPDTCVDIMSRIAARTERSGGARYASELTASTPRESLVSAAVNLADNLKAQAILTFTRQGRLATLIAAYRPKTARILAFTPDPDVAQRLILSYGLVPFLMDFSPDRQETVEQAVVRARDAGHLRTHETVVVISDVLSHSEGIVDSIQVHSVP
jgi:pyruvate kinase